MGRDMVSEMGEGEGEGEGRDMVSEMGEGVGEGEGRYGE